MTDSPPNEMRRTKLAIVVSHPIQHFVPFYRAIAADPTLECKVIYASRIGLEAYFDAEMKTEISWSMDLLSGYDHEFLPEAETIKEINFSNVNNPSVHSALDRCGPDVIFCYGYAQITQLRTLLWARRRGVPVLTTGDSELLRQRSNLRLFAKSVGLKLLLRQYSAILAVGDANQAFWEHYGVPRERIFRCPFTIDESVYRKAHAERQAIRAAFRQEKGIPQDALVAVSVGKLSGRKRPLDLAAAAAILKARGRNVHCLFAGNGDQMEPLKQALAASGVDATLLGFVNVDRLPAAYAAADILVHPSEADPHPLVMSEAACVGLPLILSDRVGALGPTDIARPGVNALSYPCGDTGALATAIESILFDPAKLKQMSAASLEVFDACDVRASLSGLKAAIAHSLASRRGARHAA